jgi:hypothetical protein
MHIVMVTAVGLILLGAFALAGHMRDGIAGAAHYFIWFWLAAAIANGIFGVVRAGIPVINEVGAFIPIFGIPAVIAFYLSRR